MKKLFSCLAVFILFFAVIRADEVSDAKQRIQARQSEVATLKSSGALGENNRGLLEVRDNAAGADKVASDENRDREVLYALIAKRTGSTADAVGRARAKEIAQGSKAGVWVQDEGGRWIKK